MGFCASTLGMDHNLPEMVILPYISNIQARGKSDCSPLQVFKGNVVGDGEFTDLDVGIRGRRVAAVVTFEWPFNCSVHHFSSNRKEEIISAY